MRLCFISHIRFFQDKGAYYYNSGFAKLLEVIAPLYDEVALCAPVYDGPAPENLEELRIPNLNLCPLPPFWQKWHLAALKHPIMLSRCIWPHVKRADIVLTNIPDYLGILSWLVCSLQRKPFVIRMEGNWPQMVQMAFQNHDMLFWGKLAAFVHKLLVKAMVRTSTLTMAIGQELADIYGMNNSNVVCVISSTFHDCDIASSVAASGSDECRVLYVGRLQNNKGLSELLRATKNLLQEGLVFRILVAGDGNRRNEIKKQVEDLGISSRVTFLGWVTIEKLREIYRTSDIYVLPSYTEGMPRTVLEAMSNGLAVVVTNVGGIPEIIQDGENGLVVPARDEPALRFALRRVILDKPLRECMAKAGLEKSHEYTMETERACVRAALQKVGLYNTPRI